MILTGDDLDRFVRKIQKGPASVCWEWVAGLSDGYGEFKVGRQMLRAHRLAWCLAHQQEVPDGLCVLHTCDNRRCCNPMHLWVGTRAENNRDREQKGRGRQPKGEDHGAARLTEQDVREIRVRYKRERIRQVDLAAQYGVYQATISSIVRGETWRHLLQEDDDGETVLASQRARIRLHLP